MPKIRKDSVETMLKQLKEPFDPKFIKWRVGATSKDKTKAIALPYLDSREVKKRLDDVCGLDGWSSKLVPLDGGFICELSIKVDGVWVTKSDAAGHTAVEPIKGGASGALKRAASTWGVGRYLYYLPNVWVPIDEYKQLKQIPELPSWAKPNPSGTEKWEDVAEMEMEADKMANGDEDQIDNEDGAPTSSALKKSIVDAKKPKK